MGVIGAFRLQSFFYSMNFRVRQIQATNRHFFSVNDNPFSIKPIAVWILISEKGTSVFLVLNLFSFFKKEKIMVAKYQHFTLSGVFQINLPDIDFTNKPCNLPQ